VLTTKTIAVPVRDWRLPEPPSLWPDEIVANIGRD
jgi:hypothetical protein